MEKENTKREKHKTENSVSTLNGISFPLLAPATVVIFIRLQAPILRRPATYVLRHAVKDHKIN